MALRTQDSSALCLWYRNVLLFFCRCRSVFGTLRHQCRTVSTFYEGAEVSSASAEVSRTDAAARSCSCITSPPHVTSAPSIVIFRLLLKTFLYIRNHTRHSNLTHNSFQSYFTFPRASCNKLLILSCPRLLDGDNKRWCCMMYVCLSRRCGLNRALQLFR